MSIDGPRLARPDEFREAMTLTNRCFGFDRGELEDRMPHCFDEAYPDRHAIVKVDDEVVSHACCVPVELRAGDTRIDCGGIAGVATDPEHRGNGYMRRLLKFWLDRLEERGVPLAELEGDRVRYGRYGWENAGREDRYRITARSFAAEYGRDDVDADSVRRFRPRSDPEAIRDVHNAERYRVSRDSRQYERLLAQTGLETLVSDAETPGYLCYRHGDPVSVLEFGGPRDGVATLLEHLLETVDEVAIYTHPTHPLVPLFRTVAADWERHPHRKLNVLDPHATLTAYRPLLEKRWSNTVDAFGGATGDVTIGMTRSNGRSDEAVADVSARTVTLAYDSTGISVERTDREPDVTLDRRETVELLFGPRDAHRPVKRSEPVLDAVFPLEYYFWRTETI